MKKIIVIIPILLLLAFKLAALEIPKATITETIATKNSISFNYSVIDTESNIIMNTKDYYCTIDLYEGKDLIESKKITETQGAQISFDNLKPDVVYNIKINVPYDAMKIGKPYNKEPYTILTKNISTANNETVADILNSSNATRDTIVVDYELKDASDASLKLISGEETEIDQSGTFVFENLEPATKYVVEILVEDEVYDTMGFKTKKAIRPPTALIYDIDEGSSIDGNDINVKYKLTDKDRVIMKEETIHPRIALYKDQELIDIYNAKRGVEQVSFKDLEAGEYQVVVTAMYDLESDGTVTNEKPYILDSKNFTIK